VPFLLTTKAKKHRPRRCPGGGNLLVGTGEIGAIWAALNLASGLSLIATDPPSGARFSYAVRFAGEAAAPGTLSNHVSTLLYGDCMNSGTGKYERLLERCAKLDPVPAAVVHPCEKTALEGAVEGGQKGLVIPILVGHTGSAAGKPTKLSSLGDGFGCEQRGWGRVISGRLSEGALPVDGRNQARCAWGGHFYRCRRLFPAPASVGHRNTRKTGSKPCSINMDSFERGDEGSVAEPVRCCVVRHGLAFSNVRLFRSHCRSSDDVSAARLKTRPHQHEPGQ